MASLAFAPTPLPALTPTQERVIFLIAGGARIGDIAEVCKIHRNTIGNWRRTNPPFAKALAEAQYDRVQYWREQAEEYAISALGAIDELLRDPETPASVRLRAALAILKHATTLPEPEAVAAAIPAEAHPEPNADTTDSLGAYASESSTSSAQPAPPVVQNGKPHNMHNSAQQATPIDTLIKVGRNAPCPCGSGKKSKLCCLNR